MDEYEYKGHDFEEAIRRTIIAGNENEINKLFDTELAIETRPLSNEIKGYIINYIFLVWSNDGGWQAIAKPMKWLNNYYNLIQPEQYVKLISVLEEYTASYPSHAAANDTSAIMAKILPVHISHFEKEFIYCAIYTYQNKSFLSHPLFKSLVEAFANSGYVSGDFIEIMKLFLEQLKLEKEILNPDTPEENKVPLRARFKENKITLNDFIRPEEDD